MFFTGPVFINQKKNPLYLHNTLVHIGICVTHIELEKRPLNLTNGF